MGKNNIQSWLGELRLDFASEAPDLLPQFDIYAAEAIFGRHFIHSDLSKLSAGAKILEIGAGALLLSCQLMREGFNVTALEPTGVGFSHFDRMRAVVANKARVQGVYPKLLDMPVEMLNETKQFDYAFSVNVMEHVKNIECALKRIGASLTINATYRFTCPNYLFPYEPHFNIPTLFFKKLTAIVLEKKILGNKRLTDPSGTWESLNWIDVIQVKRYVQRLPNFTLTFNTSILFSSIERIASDTEFACRRSPAIRRMLLILLKLRLHIFFKLLPAYFQPLMDCRITKLME